MPSERGAHQLWALLPKPRRTLQIGKEERHSPRRRQRHDRNVTAHRLLGAGGVSHVYQTRIHADRAGDAEYADAALRHTKAVVDRARARDAQSSLVTALLTHGCCHEASGDPAAAVAVQSEVIELGEAIGLGTLVDAARAGLVESITQIAVADSGDLQQAANALRTALADGLARRNVLFVLNYLAGGIERLLWHVGDHRTAALLGRYARRNLTSWSPPTIVNAALGTDELGAIDAEATSLDVDRACAIALAALDKIIETN